MGGGLVSTLRICGCVAQLLRLIVHRTYGGDVCIALARTIVEPTLPILKERLLNLAHKERLLHLVDVGNVVEALNLGVLDLRDRQVRVKQRLVQRTMRHVTECPKQRQMTVVLGRWSKTQLFDLRHQQVSCVSETLL